MKSGSVFLMSVLIVTLAHAPVKKSNLSIAEKYLLMLQKDQRTFLVFKGCLMRFTLLLCALLTMRGFILRKNLVNFLRPYGHTAAIVLLRLFKKLCRRL